MITKLHATHVQSKHHSSHASKKYDFNSSSNEISSSHLPTSIIQLIFQFFQRTAESLKISSWEHRSEECAQAGQVLCNMNNKIDIFAAIRDLRAVALLDERCSPIRGMFFIWSFSCRFLFVLYVNICSETYQCKKTDKSCLFGDGSKFRDIIFS